MATFSETTFKSPRDVWSTHKVLLTRMTGPASYATGGDPISGNTSFGAGNIDAIIPCGVAWNGSASRLLYWDATNQKMVWVVPNTGAEVANATDLSAYVVDLVVVS